MNFNSMGNAQKVNAAAVPFNKTPVFGTFKHSGIVYTEIVPDRAKATLQVIIRGHVNPDGFIHSYRWHGDTGLVDLGSSKHQPVTYGNNQFTKGHGQINFIE